MSTEDARRREYVAMFIQEVGETLAVWEDTCVLLTKAKDPEALDQLLRVAHNVKGGAAIIGLSSISAYAHRIEDVVNLVKGGQIVLERPVLDLFFEARRNFSAWLKALESDFAFAPSTDQLLLELDAFLEAHSSQSEVRKEQLSNEEIQNAVATQVEAQQAVSHEAVVDRRSAPRAEKKVVNETLRVQAKRLDDLIQIVGELSIQQSVVWHCKQRGDLNSDRSMAAISLIQKIVKELQLQSLSLRMQPLKSLFQKLEMAGRDVARKQNKTIEFRIIGDQVELDRSVIERMSEPMVHLLRNAVDHGIEPDDARAADVLKGPAEICLEAVQKPASVVIRVRDNGRGLNPDKILAKAQRLGMISVDQKVTREDIYEFIFKHGFSTSDAVTDISGRGVGMDIVRKEVENLNGTISVKSDLGIGTTFEMQLPTSLSIIDAFIIHLNGTRYAVPIYSTDEIIDLKSVKIETTTSRGRMLRYRDEVVPLEDLASYFSQVGAPLDAASSTLRHRPTALLVSLGRQKVAFKTDGVLGQQQIVVRPLSEKLQKLPSVSGVAILGNGEPSLIVDLTSLARSYLNFISDREGVA